MKITNKYNLPEPLYRILARDNYSKGLADYSVTTLIGPPKIAILQDVFDDQIEIDASDRLWSVFGNIAHEMIAQGSEGLEDYISEQRLFAVVNEVVVSGGIDLQHVEDGVVDICDWKTTSSYAVVNGKDEWEYQLNLYAHLVRTQKKMKVRNLQIGALIKDWSAGKARFDSFYPQHPIQMIDIPVWSPEEAEKVVEELVHDHQTARIRYELSGELPDCTPSQMWQSGGQYALMKRGAKRASWTYTERLTAEKELRRLNGTGGEYYIEDRPVKRIRCEEYCSVNQFCDQYKAFMRDKRN